MKNNFLIILLVTFGWFFYTLKITEVPPGINGDEAVIGYNAALVARTGFDSRGNYLPIFTTMPDSLDWKQPVTFYATVLVFKLFGPSYFTLRAVSTIFVLLSGFLIFLLIKELLGYRTAILGLLIFFTIPIVMIQSHLAIENIAPVPLVAFWLWMIIKYAKVPKLKYLSLAGASLGLSTYSYLGLRLIMPILMFLSVAFIYYLNKKSLKRAVKHIIVFLLVTIPFLFFLLLLKNQYPGAILGQYRGYNITSYQQLILPYISSFDPSFLFISGDITPYHSTGKHGVFLLASLPLFILGAIKIIQNRSPILFFSLISFFLIPLLFGLGSDIHRGSRLLASVPFYTLISSAGFIFIWNIKDRLWRMGLISLLLFLMVANYTDFLTDYWYDYPKRVQSEFARPIHIAFQTLYDESNKLNLTPYMQRGLEGQNPTAFKFFEEIYFQSQLKRWETNSLPEDSVILANMAGIKEKGLDEKNLKSLELENLDYYLLKNK